MGLNADMDHHVGPCRIHCTVTMLYDLATFNSARAGDVRCVLRPFNIGTTSRRLRDSLNGGAHKHNYTVSTLFLGFSRRLTVRITHQRSQYINILCLKPVSSRIYGSVPRPETLPADTRRHGQPAAPCRACPTDTLPRRSSARPGGPRSRVLQAAHERPRNTGHHRGDMHRRTRGSILPHTRHLERRTGRSVETGSSLSCPLPQNGPFLLLHALVPSLSSLPLPFDRIGIPLPVEANMFASHCCCRSWTRCTKTDRSYTSSCGRSDVPHSRTSYRKKAIPLSDPAQSRSHRNPKTMTTRPRRFRAR